MNNLSDQLKALGIEVGLDSIKSQPIQPDFLAKDLGGQVIENYSGNLVLVENHYELETFFPQESISPIILKWANSAVQELLGFSDFTIMDIETTGMLGESGVLAFLVGLGTITDNQFTVQQFLITNPAQEMAQLTTIEAQFAKAKGIITYNGKSFDLPILSNRYRFHRSPPPFKPLIHLDLLHLARRIWKNRLPNRALRNIEAEILDVQRKVNDIPGWIIPQIYHEFIQTKRPELLLPVLYHNQMDVYSLARLFIHLNQLIENPNQSDFDYEQDQIALAHFYENLGFYEQAIPQYQKCILGSKNLEDKVHLMEDLAMLYKKQKDFSCSINLWEQAASMGSIISHVELAKYYEHITKDYSFAYSWTESALKLVNSKKEPPEEHIRWQPELQYRLERLARIIHSHFFVGGKP